MQKDYFTIRRKVSTTASRVFKTLLLLLIVLNAAPVIAQQKVISGTVSDEKNLPLIGAGIKIKGKTTATSVDADGKFTIAANLGDILQVSFIGYKTIEKAVGDNSSINFSLQPDNSNLNEVTVVGYGTQSSAKVTGAIATVKMDEVLGDRPVSTVGQLLQSTVPGLQVSLGSGQPGATTAINLRGATSINTSGNSFSQGGPLILVDNVPLNGGLNLLDPNDIETVTVLKDAGSAAIYGGRSAFGVILITTKKGKLNQKPTFNYSNNIIFANAVNLPKKASADQFLQMLKDMGTVGYWSGQNVDTWIQLYNDAKVNPEKYPTGIANGIYPVRENDVLGDYLGSNVPQLQNNISVSGGTEKTNYRLSLGAINEKGVIVPEAKQDYFKRYNVKSFISTEVNKWFTAQLDAGYYSSIASRPANSLFGNAVDFSPLVPTADNIPASNGEVGINGTPKTIVLNGAPNVVKKNDIRITGRGILKPLKGLTVTGEYTYDKIASDSVAYNKAFSVVRPTNFQVQPQGDGTYELANYGTVYNALNIFANYQKSIGNHHFAALLGYNREESQSPYTSVSRNGMISIDYPSISNATGPITASNSLSEFSLNGIFWRLNYDYKGKYLAQVNQRYDGSSKFPPNHRFGTFPSGSLGWVVSEEDFFKQNIRLVSNLKLRASFGEVGDQQSASSYGFIPTLSRYQPFWLNGTSSYLNSLNAPGIISSDYTWSTVRTLDFGFDFGLLKNRLSGSFDWFKRDTKDILATGAVPLPNVLGTPSPLENTASITSKGIEISINWNDKIGKDISYRIGVNVYDYKSEVTKFDGNPSNLLSSYYVGQQLGEIWGYTTDRLYTVDDFVAGSLTANLTGGTLKPGIPKFQDVSPNPGDVLYKDLNGDGIIKPGLSTLEDYGDRTIIGNSTARYQFGINGGFTFKNFDFSFVLRGVAKRDYYIDNNITFPNRNGFSTAFAHNLDYWTPTNTDAFFARIYDQAGGNQGNNQGTVQTRYLQSGAFLQISNLGLGYSLPTNLLNRVRISSFKVFASVENPFIFSRLPKGLDPSLDNVGGGLGYPFLRKTSIGVNLTF